MFCHVSCQYISCIAMSFNRSGSIDIFAHMDTIRGTDALAKAETITKTGGNFNVMFYSYSRSKHTASDKLKTLTCCHTRTPMPHEKWSVDGAHYFLFDYQGLQRQCYKVLLRFIAFSPDYKLLKVKWYE